MSRSGLAGPSMENHMDMSHLQMPKHMSVPPQEEPSELEELELFAKAFKQRRIKLGFTQVSTASGKTTCYLLKKRLQHYCSCLTPRWTKTFKTEKSVDTCTSCVCVFTGRCGPCNGKTVREWFQSDHNLSLRGSQPQLQEHVQAQTSAGEMAEWCRYNTLTTMCY